MSCTKPFITTPRLDEVALSEAQGSPSGPEKGEQVGIELVFVRVGETVRPTRVDLQDRVLDECGRGVSRGADRHDLVVVSMNDEGWHVELLEVLGEVRFGKRLDAVELVLETAPHTLKPERVADALADLRARPVGAEEGRTEILKELRAVGGNTGADTIERLHWQAAGIGVRLEHQWRHRAHQHDPGDAPGAMAPDVAGDLSAAGRVADQSGAT